MATDKKTGHRIRLRERFLAGEERSKTETALLELLLTYALPRKDVRRLAEQLVAEYGGLSGVLAASPESLRRFKGIQAASGTLLKLVDYLRIHHTVQDTAKADPPNPAPNTEPQLTPKPVQAPESTNGGEIGRREAGLFSNAVLKDAIELLPGLPDTESLDEVRRHLRKHLRYNAESTRERYACYIARRMFPNGVADSALRNFAKHFRGDRNLREVCFYRFIKAEPLVEEVARELLASNIGKGRLERRKLGGLLENRFPGHKNIGKATLALVDALATGGVIKADRENITFAYRDIPFPAFAFIFHDEFPEPGAYDLSKAEKNNYFKAMLWNPDLVLPMIYEMRNRGLIGKVSEIDDVRQFTTRYGGEEIVETWMEGEGIRKAGDTDGHG